MQSAIELLGYDTACFFGMTFLETGCGESKKTRRVEHKKNAILAIP